MAKRRPDEQAYITHGDLKIPVSVYFERRRNTRISIGAETIHLRLPKNLDKKEFNDQLLWAQKWLHKRFEKAPNLLERFKLIQFHHGDRINIMSDVYVLHLEEGRRKSSNASLSNQDIFISLAIGLEGKDRHKVIQTLVHKLLCKRYLTFIRQRVKELNDIHFQQPYARVVLKYIHSKWGSCSHNGDIVLSSKLLLCPDWARDYVIIHELAHLIELNHSAEFWALVEQAMPNYDKAERWLNDEGTALEVRPIRSTKLHGVMPNESLAQKAPVKQAEELPAQDLVNETKGSNKPSEIKPQMTKSSELFPLPQPTPASAPTKKKRRPKKKTKVEETDSGKQLELF